MANKRITQLNEFIGNPAANDVFVFVENSSLSTYKITYSNLLSSNNILVNSVYTNVRDNSASWEESAYITPLQAASASWDSTYTSVRDTSANWDSTYTQFSTNSATYATIGFADGKFLPLSGGDITGNITSTGIVSTNNDASFASLSTLNINVNNFSNTVGVSAGVYLSITVSGSAFKIPLYLV